MHASDKSIVLLSPHSDDIALSVGGWLAKLNRVSPERLKHATILTIFSWSKSAPHLPSIHGNSVKVTKARAEEEKSYSDIYQLGLSFGDLPDTSFLNIDYRQDLHVCNDQRFEYLKKELKDLIKDKVVFAPLSLGEHIDHRIVFDCSRILESESALTLYYEDLPYATWYTDKERDEIIKEKLGALATPLCIQLSESDREEKTNNLDVYKSQLNNTEIETVCSFKLSEEINEETLWYDRSRNVDLSILENYLIG